MSAIISSMTKQEKGNPSIINGSRKKRIALGSGVQIQDVNKLLKQFKNMQLMMKKISKHGVDGMEKMLSNNLGTNNLGNMLNNLRKIEEIMSVKIRLSRHGAKKKTLLQNSGSGY